jgi:branched-chain amino acid transport system permease protein
MVMYTLDFILEVLARGLGIGMVYALMGLGLTLIFGVMRIINFAQGEFYMLGGYATYFLMVSFGVPFIAALPLSMVAVFLVGILVEGLLLSPTRTGNVGSAMEYSLIITFALSLFLQKLAIILFGPFYRKVPDYLPGNVGFGPLGVPGNTFVAMVVSGLLILAVTLYLSRTWRGRSWRAMAQCLNGASISGVPTARESSLVFGLSTALAAAAGAVLIPVTLVFPNVGTSPLIKGYQIIAIGGLGSVPGSLIGGLLLGVVETYGSIFISSAYRDLYGFGLLILFLLFRPRGLYGQA